MALVAVAVGIVSVSVSVSVSGGGLVVLIAWSVVVVAVVVVAMVVAGSLFCAMVVREDLAGELVGVSHKNGRSEKENEKAVLLEPGAHC